MSLIESIFTEEIINNRVDGIDKKTFQEKLQIFPYRVEIQPTTFCNRACDFCSHSIRNQTGNELPENKVKELIDCLVMHSCNHISFSGGGEPFEWRNGDICKAIQYASQQMDVTITTNGDGFWNNQTESAQNLSITQYCSNIIINTPEVDDERYKKFVKGKSSWSKTKKIIISLLDYIKQNACKCEICCVVVVSKLNYQFLADIDKELQGIGVNKIYYKMIKTFEDNGMYKLANSVEEFVDLRKRIGKGISFWLRDFFESVDIVEGYYSQKCWSNEMGMNAIIDPNGNVYICTPTVGLLKYALGNVFESDFAELWQSKKRLDLIERLNRVHSIKKCPKECRLNSHNAMIENYLFDNEINNHIVMNAGVDNTMLILNS